MKHYGTPAMFIVVACAAALTGHNAIWLAMAILLCVWCWQERKRKVRESDSQGR